jgi:hypothetical protein
MVTSPENSTDWWAQAVKQLGEDADEESKSMNRSCPNKFPVFSDTGKCQDPVTNSGLRCEKQSFRKLSH